MTAENDSGNTNFLNTETQEGALFCYTLIRDGVYMRYVILNECLTFINFVALPHIVPAMQLYLLDTP